MKMSLTTDVEMVSNFGKRNLKDLNFSSELKQNK